MLEEGRAALPDSRRGGEVLGGPGKASALPESRLSLHPLSLNTERLRHG